MKTNISIEINDDQRRLLADLVDGKKSARLIKRAELVQLCRQHIGGLLGYIEDKGPPPKPGNPDDHRAGLYRLDPEDRALMARPEDRGYRRGWNLVKDSANRQGAANV